MNDLKILENDLVPVYETDKGIKVVNGRELHCVLQSKQDFSTWVKKRLEDCDAEENKDFERLHKKMEANNATMIEYIIKLDTAKEMAMLERNEKGKRVRKYFIAIEEKYKQTALDLSQLSPELQMFNQIFNTVASQQLEQKRLAEQQKQLEIRIEKAVETTQNIKQALNPVYENWRVEINAKFNRIQRNSDKHFDVLRTEMYLELENQAGCDLNARIRNKRKRMENDGCTKTKIERLNKMDIIEEDKKLREIFSKIVTEYEIKYCS